MDDQESSHDLLLKPAKREKSSDFDHCIMCQLTNDEPLGMAHVSPIQIFLSAMKIHQDEVFVCLSPNLATLEEWEIVWHSCYYETYTQN